MNGGKNTDLATIDPEVPDLATDPGESPGTWALAEVDPVKELAKFEAVGELMRKLVPATIRMTRPQDWVRMGDKVYLQGTGVERFAPLWGLVFGEPTVERIDYEDGHFDYVVTGAAGSRRTGVVYRSIQGGRSSRDSFFWPKVSEDGRLVKGYDGTKPILGERFDPKAHVDPLDVRKAAVTNWQTRAAAMLTGTRGLSLDDLKDAGIDTNKVTGVDFQRGKRGGATETTDLKAAQVQLGNEILKRSGGDKDLAALICQKVTAYKTKAGKEGSYSSPSDLKFDWQIDRAREALAALTKDDLFELEERLSVQQEGGAR